MKKKGIGKQEAVTSRYEKMADEGMSKEATDAMRAKMVSNMAQAEKMAGMKMGGMMGGARGASAGAMMAGMQQQQMMGRANVERDILLESEKAKERGLAGMSGSLAAERQATGDYTSSLGSMKTFDIGQATAEKQLKGSMGMQYEQMASAERAAEKAAQAQIAAANAQKSGKK